MTTPENPKCSVCHEPIYPATNSPTGWAHADRIGLAHVEGPRYAWPVPAAENPKSATCATCGHEIIHGYGATPPSEWYHVNLAGTLAHQQLGGPVKPRLNPFTPEPPAERSVCIGCGRSIMRSEALPSGWAHSRPYDEAFHRSVAGESPVEPRPPAEPERTEATAGRVRLIGVNPTAAELDASMLDEVRQWHKRQTPETLASRGARLEAAELDMLLRVADERDDLKAELEDLRPTVEKYDDDAEIVNDLDERATNIAKVTPLTVEQARGILAVLDVLIEAGAKL